LHVYRVLYGTNVVYWLNVQLCVVSVSSKSVPPVDPLSHFVLAMGILTRFIPSAQNVRLYSSAKHFLENVTVKSRNGNVDVSQLQNKALLLYFSAGWCKSCQHFTPKLKQFYETTKDQGVEILWISRDKSAEDQKAYYEKSLPAWPYVEYGDQIKHFNEFYEAKTIPNVKLVNPDGEVIDATARVEIESAMHEDDGPKKLVEEWKKKLNL
jgi:nucleoredoxin